MLLHPCTMARVARSFHSPGEARPTPVRLVVGPAHRHAVGGVSVHASNGGAGVVAFVFHFREIAAVPADPVAQVVVFDAGDSPSGPVLSGSVQLYAWLLRPPLAASTVGGSSAAAGSYTSALVAHAGGPIESPVSGTSVFSALLRVAVSPS